MVENISILFILSHARRIQMKPYKYLLMILSINLTPNILVAQSSVKDSKPEKDVTMETIIGYLQAYDENMQQGIVRLNLTPQTPGITAVNGALLLNATDISLPGRSGSTGISRYYNGKLWYGDFNGQIRIDSLQPISWLGQGWDLHFGRLYYGLDTIFSILETAGGKRIFFKDKRISTDGSFMKLSGDTLVYDGNGSRIYFKHQNYYGSQIVAYPTKIIDRNSNITNFYYGESELDSIKTSANRTARFYYHIPASQQLCVILDSIKYYAPYNDLVKIALHYDTTAYTDYSPFDANNTITRIYTYLLKSIVYPDGDSIRYHYNRYFELDSVYLPTGGIVSYVWKTDTFYKPNMYIVPPYAYADKILQLTRGVSEVRNYDPYTAPNTIVTQYRRFRNNTGTVALSNADSVEIIDPAGNISVSIFVASRGEPGRSNHLWVWTNGQTVRSKYLDANRNQLEKIINNSTRITSDSIGVLWYTEQYNGRQTYETMIDNYDSYGNPTSIHNYGDIGKTTDDCWITKAYSYDTDKYIVHTINEEYVCSDGSGSNKANWKKYFYDTTGYIVKFYPDSVYQWESIPGFRGNVTSIKQWKGGSDWSTTQFRYDKVGNIVMMIVHPTTSTADTTFTYYNPSDTAYKYQYAYPWRNVNHVSSSACSLETRTEYDRSTSLPVKIFDVNNDSTVITYDILGRILKVWLFNKTSNPNKIMHYFKYKNSPQQPMALMDSILLDGGKWMSSKVFYDGFGRKIQTKQYDSNSERMIVQNTAYNLNGLQDTTTNPYDSSGISYDYSSPVWSNITSYEYDGLNRPKKITHPDAEYITFKYDANRDTIIDEKGNKTIFIYNAYGSVDTVIDALSNATIYTYDYLGRLMNVKDAETKNKKYYYDVMSRLRAVDGPDASSDWTYAGYAVDNYYEYDDIGNLITMKDGQGTKTYFYDELKRLTDVKFYNGFVTVDMARMTYDEAFSPPSPYSEFNNPKGRLGKSVTCGIDSTLFYYNDRGNLTRKKVAINGLSGVKSYTYKYNIAGQCTLFYGAGNVYYHYDKFSRLNAIPNILTSNKYSPAGLPVRNNYANSTWDTTAYDSRLRPKKIKAVNPFGSSLMKLTYTYEKNSNVDSIIDSVVTNNRQKFVYDSLNRLTNVNSPCGNQSFTYDKVGNRLTKNGNNYTYVSGTNRIDNVGSGWTYRYDDCGNVIRRSNAESVTDTFIYNWHNRLVSYTKGSDNVDFAYNISGLRVKKHYYTTGGKGESGSMGTGFADPANDMGLKSQDADSVYNQGRDISKVWLKNTANNYEFTIVNEKLFDAQNKVKLFITLDIDTIENSGRITLPEDTLTKVPKKAAWEYCLFMGNNEYGFYTQSGVKHSNPMGMLVNKVFGDSGKVTLKISKQLLNNVPAIRYTLSTFAPGLTNSDSLWQGGSSAVDVWPGSKKTFGGEINGYGQITPNSVTLSGEYTIYYIYDGIDPIVEYTPDGSVLNRYIYANGKHVAEIAGADTTWYYSDALGSTRKMANESGSSVWSSVYYPFGEMAGNGGNEHSFTGKEFDAEVGLNYFCMRYYDPEIGRFLELDPVDQFGTSPYVYCFNNPSGMSDPMGTDPNVEEWGAPWKISNDDWSWIEQNINSMDIPERMAQRAGWFTARSWQMDPDFWFKGWDWSINFRGIFSQQEMEDLRQKVYALSSGVCDFEVLTDEGWITINPGLFIMANGIYFEKGDLIDKFAVVSATNQRSIVLDFNKLYEHNYTYWDLMAIIFEEVVHLTQYSYGFQPCAYTQEGGESIVRATEIQAIYLDGLYFYNVMSDFFQQNLLAGLEFWLK